MEQRLVSLDALDSLQRIRLLQRPLERFPIAPQALRRGPHLRRQRLELARAVCKRAREPLKRAATVAVVAQVCQDQPERGELRDEPTTVGGRAPEPADVPVAEGAQGARELDQRDDARGHAERVGHVLR